MQELKLLRRYRLLNSRGSVLVGVIAISILMAIADIAFLQVTTSSLKNETSSLENEKAFWAAESGIWIGVRWLRIPANYTPITGTYYPFGTSSSYVTINDMDVYVTVSVSGPVTAPVIVLTSDVYKDPAGSHQKLSSTFCKRLAVNSARATFYGQYGTLFDQASAGWAGFISRVFDGRFHMNRSIMISSNAQPGMSNDVVFKNGLVTTGTNNPFNGNYGKGSHDNNNYNSGIQLNGWVPATAALCDNILQAGYLSNQDNVSLPVGLDATDFATNPAKKDLPASWDEGEDYNDYRPTLELGIKAAKPFYRYYYNNSATGLPSGRTCDSNFYNDGTIFLAGNNINIYGTTLGQATVATKRGFSICPVDNLTYSDYTIATNSVPAGSTSVLGLVSGRAFRFNHQWKKDFSGSAVQIAIPSNLYLNGSFMAVEQNAPAWQGTEWWDYTYAENYNLTLFGNHVLNQWRPPTSGTKGAQGTLTFSHDLRLVDQINPPGFPCVRSADGLWIISMDGWCEKNKL